MILHRRELLRMGGGLAAGGIAATAFASGARRRSLGLADVTVSRYLSRDYAGTLRKAAAMGYTHFGFRLSGYGPTSSELSASDKAKHVRDAGLEIGPVRFGVQGVDYDRQIAQAVEIGAKIIVMTTAPVFVSGRQLGQTTRAAFDAWLPELAALGAKCRAAGLTFAYHNHPWDLLPLEGEAPLDTMLRLVPPRDLAIELDLAWCWYAGVAPLDMLARLGPRVVSMHFKDIDRNRGKSATDHAVVIGSGDMGYGALLPRIPQLTSAVGFIEVDSPDDGLVAAEQGARFFRQTMSKVR